MSDDKPQFDWDSDAGFDEEGDGPSMDEVGEFAEDYDHTQRPRRVQMNVKIADEVKQRFKEKVEAENLEMQFVVEDLLRMYLRNS